MGGNYYKPVGNLVLLRRISDAIKNMKNTISSSDRFVAFLIDFFLISCLCTLVCAPALTAIRLPPNYIFYSGGVFFNLYCLKDIYNGRSIGKRAFKLQVVDSRSNEAASLLQCYIRNIFLILWPIEVVVWLIFRRRVGDMIAMTKVDEYDKSRTHNKLINIAAFAILAQCIVYCIGLPLKLPLSNISNTITNLNRSSGMSPFNMDFVLGSYNDAESKEVSDSLSRQLGVEVKLGIYDKAKTKNQKYISARIELKKDDSIDPVMLEQLKKKFIRSLRAQMYPSEILVKFGFSRNDSILSISKYDSAVEADSIKRHHSANKTN